jgi:hypothetical protein
MASLRLLALGMTSATVLGFLAVSSVVAVFFGGPVRPGLIGAGVVSLALGVYAYRFARGLKVPPPGAAAEWGVLGLAGIGFAAVVAVLIAGGPGFTSLVTVGSVGACFLAWQVVLVALPRRGRVGAVVWIGAFLALVAATVLLSTSGVILAN